MHKQDLIRQAHEGYAGLMAAIDGMDELALTTPGIGDWSVREILAHIAGWAVIDAGIMRRLAHGERPLPEGEEYGTGESRNPGYAAGAAAKSATTVLAELRVAFDEFLAAAQSVPEDRFSDGRTAHRLMQESALQHLHEHRREIETFRAELGGR